MMTRSYTQTAAAISIMLLGTCLMAPEASAQNKRYSIPKQLTAKVQPVRVTPPKLTGVKPAVQTRLAAPPATRFAAPPPSAFRPGAGMVAAGGGNMVAAGGGNMVAAGAGNLRTPSNTSPANLISPGNRTGVIGQNGATLRR